MDATLRPLSLGEILDRTFQLYRSHFLMFAGISCFAAGLDLIWKLIQTTTVRAVQPRVGSVALGGVSAGFGLVSFIVYVIVSAAAMAAISRAVSAIYLGQPTGIAQAYREVKPHWFRYVRVAAAALFMSWGPTILISVAIVGIAVAIPGFNNAIGPLITVGILSLSFLLIIPFGIWMLLRYSVCIPASLFEDLGVRASLKRSIHLSKGAMQKLSIFVLILLVWVISAVITYAGLTPLLVSVFRTAFAHGKPVISVGMTIYTLAVQFIVASITIPLYGIGLTLFYYDARIRKEGFDVEWLIQRSTPEAIEPPAPSLPPAESAGQA
ncbi:MAG TPA: hypothetical protein VN678_04475 [Acidobacteriaceae bacterium]|nr:hypothetical protein [Acidobacteriaceae bacterium]